MCTTWLTCGRVEQGEVQSYKGGVSVFSFMVGYVSAPKQITRHRYSCTAAVQQYIQHMELLVPRIRSRKSLRERASNDRENKVIRRLLQAPGKKAKLV